MHVIDFTNCLRDALLQHMIMPHDILTPMTGLRGLPNGGQSSSNGLLGLRDILRRGLIDGTFVLFLHKGSATTLRITACTALYTHQNSLEL